MMVNRMVRVIYICGGGIAGIPSSKRSFLIGS